MRNIIFDLGNVLVNVDFKKFKQGLLSDGINSRKFENLFAEKLLRDKLESGQITSKKFINYVTEELDNSITAERFIFHFNSMFTENIQMKKFLIKLHRKQRYKLILLSNTNPIHFDYIKSKFNFMNLFNYFALSYKLRMLKPDIRIYNKVRMLYNLKPEESLFIDDLEENCTAAARAGMNVINYTEFRKFSNEINKYITV